MYTGGMKHGVRRAGEKQERGQRLLPAMLLGLFVGGCSSYEAPSLDVAAVRLREQTAQGVVFDFTLDAENSNSEAIPLRSVRYTLYLDGDPVFTGFRSPEATLRRFGTQQVKLPAVMELGAGKSRPTGTVDYRLEGTIEYITPGELAKLLYDSDIQRPTVSFLKEGKIDLGS